MNAIVSKRSHRGMLALMLLLGLTLWGGGGVELASATTDFHGSPTEFLLATQGDTYNFTFVNEETQVSNLSDSLHGILNVLQISATDANGNETIWASGFSDGTQLTGQFDGLTVASITPVTGGDIINFRGGELALYNVPNSTYSPDAGGPGDPALDICGGPCPSPLLTANFASGIVPSEAGVTLSSTVSETTSPFTGSGSGYLDTGTTTGFGTGADNGLLNHGGLPTNFGARDLLLGTFLCSGGPNCTNPSSDWPVYSNPGSAVNPVPEPASVILVGAGLGALGLWRRMARAPKA